MNTKRPEDLTVEELRRLLLEKRRVTRRERLERFKQTGRALSLTLDISETRLEDPLASSQTEPAAPAAAPLSARRLWLDRILLGVETLAVLGLIGIGLLVFGVMRSLNREMANALEQPSPQPTALLQAVVLPSGHTPPNAPGGAQFNAAEIPEHLRPLAQSLENLPIPTASPAQAVRIQIPALSVDAPVVQGDSWEQLKKGVGQHLGTPNPGQNGNIVVSAHNDVFGELFRSLDRLQPGDQVILYTAQRAYTYIVTGTQLVEPTQVEVMAATPRPSITLISCYPYLIDNQRIVVSAELQTP